MRSHRLSSRLTHALALLFVSALGCGGPVKNERDIQFRVQHAESPDTRREAPLKGSLDEDDIRRVFDEHAAGFNNCFRMSAASYVSGEVQLTVTVKPNGRVEGAFVSRSTLGAWKAEDCLLQQVRFLEFPVPQNGRARFAYPLQWNAEGQRLSTLREPAYGYATLARNRPVIDQCRETYGYQGPYTLTLYVGQMGQVLNAGFSSPDAPGDEFGACVVDVVQGLRFPSSGPVTARYVALMENLKDDLTPMNRDFD